MAGDAVSTDDLVAADTPTIELLPAPPGYLAAVVLVESNKGGAVVEKGGSSASVIASEA